MALTTASDFIMHFDWIIEQGDVFDSNYLVKPSIKLISPEFGSEDDRYKFTITLDTTKMIFRLHAINNDEHVLYGFRIRISGLFNQQLQRRMPDFQNIENAWLRWQPTNFDGNCATLCLSCDVEIKPRSRFYPVHISKSAKTFSASKTIPKGDDEDSGENSTAEGSPIVNGAKNEASSFDVDANTKAPTTASCLCDNGDQNTASAYPFTAVGKPTHYVMLMMKLWKMRCAMHECDFCFVCDGSRIYLHKSVVSASSDYLHQISCVRDELEVDGIASSAVESAVYWIEFFEDICIFAERYRVDLLLEEIRRFLTSTMQLENVIERLLLVSRLTNEEIKEVVVKFFKNNKDQILASEAWEEFSSLHRVEAFGALVAVSALHND
ncbi:hypothetical protein M514_11062 [Trichuris suis]|uniref:BTB domain-containing protein n=1 Tax=Trichuris suis TaxID=68888 RepID=A0A085N0X8_9BILA|nr:hypothetical protein M514_11062 [Trichuris suis]